MRGMAVFPLRPPDKIPLTKHGCLDATADFYDPDKLYPEWDEERQPPKGAA
jgi:hypothetical protein